MSGLAKRLAPYRKEAVVALGVLAQALSLGLLPAPADKYVTALFALLVALGVHVPNEPKQPKA